MSLGAPESSVVKSRVFLITWLLALGLALWLVENLWVDAWLRAKFGSLPTLVPEALTPLWFVVFALGGIVCVVLVVCLVLVSRHRRISVPGKVCTGIAVVGACALWGVWFSATSGATSAVSAGAGQQKHSVTLTWNQSTSPVVGYNVYRSTIPGRDYVKINAALVQGKTSYKDETVESGKTYSYVTRSVDAKGKESGDSVEVVVTVP
jgi:hypothetical protein